jgi:hypothetical protein
MVKLNHGLNMYCKFSNFIFQKYLNIYFGKQKNFKNFIWNLFQKL